MNDPLFVQRSPYAAKHVLIVDDDAFSRDLISEMLMQLGVSSIHAASGAREAMHILPTLPRIPDLLICDIFMPEMDGFELLSELVKISYRGGIMLVSGKDISVLDIAQQVALEGGLRLIGAYAKPVPQTMLEQVLETARLQMQAG